MLNNDGWLGLNPIELNRDGRPGLNPRWQYLLGFFQVNSPVWAELRPINSVYGPKWILIHYKWALLAIFTYGPITGPGSGPFYNIQVHGFGFISAFAAESSRIRGFMLSLVC